MMKRTALALSLSAATILLAGEARTEDRPKVPTWSELPAGQLTAPPKAGKKKVSFVGAGQSVPGLFVVAERGSANVPAAQRSVSVVGDAKLAAAIKRGEGFGREATASNACFADDRFFAMEDDDDAPREWNEGLSFSTDLYVRHPDNPMSGVRAVHSERLVRTGADATLESIDAYVDPSTRGARLITKATLPLKRIGQAIGGVEVFAGRDERPDGRRFVQFVIVQPQSRGGMGGPRFVIKQDGSTTPASGCGHVRVSLPVEKNDGEAATLATMVDLPSPDGKKVELSEKAVVSPASFKSKKPIFRRPAVAPAGTQERELRVREMTVQVSVSQSSRDKEPLVSVSYAWVGREQVQRVFEPETPTE